MKITRLKSGYRITLSDTDMGMLRNLVVEGIAAEEGREEFELRTDWSAAEKAAWSRRVKQAGDAYALLMVDEDRRGDTEHPEGEPGDHLALSPE